MVGPPNSSGNLAQRGGERERERGKHQDKNKPYTFPLFSPFKTQIELCCFLCFCCIRDSLLLFQVKEERKKKKKLKKKRRKVDMKWEMRERKSHSSWHIFPQHNPTYVSRYGVRT
jgi:hypothetical protein